MTVPQSSTFHGPQDQALLDWNAANLLDSQADRYGDSVATISVYQNKQWTYCELRDSVRKLASRLISLGVNPGDRVILLAGNGLEFIQVVLAVAAIGAITVIVNPTFSVDEVEYAINTVEPLCIFLATRIGFRGYSDVLQRNLGNAAVVFFGAANVTATPKDCLVFDTLIAAPGTENEQSALDSRWGQVSPDEPCCFQFTSGTTGARKASMLSHRNLINNGNLVGHQLQLSTTDKVCCCPPLSHCFGLVCGLLASCLHGSTLVIPSEIFNPSASLKSLRDHSCTLVHAVPSMFEALLAQEKKRRADGPSEYCLRAGIIAGSTPPRDLLISLKDILGLENLLYPFGMTELSAVCLCTSMKDSLIADNSAVGTAMPHTSIKVIDEAGETLPPNTIGELCVTGYLVHLGYFRNEAKTKEALMQDTSGQTWLRTGDLVILDILGRCKVVGRSKDMIKKHGENIAPGDIENLLLAHADIARAAVVGIPNKKFGESIVAFIEMSNRGAVDDKEVKTWLRQQKLAPHKMPDQFLPIGDLDGAIQEIPINTSGKIMKMELRKFAESVMGV